MESDRGEITLLLDRLAGGDPGAEEDLISRVYLELHKLATARMNRERPGHTMQATELVHEAYVRLCRSNAIEWKDRGHFFRSAGRLMRHILVDHARHRNATKRSRGMAVPLDEAISVSNADCTTAVLMDEILKELAQISPRQAQVVEMRFFAGLTEEEIALALGKNVRTVRRDWLMARAWLHKKLGSS